MISVLAEIKAVNGTKNIIASVSGYESSYRYAIKQSGSSGLYTGLTSPAISWDV